MYSTSAFSISPPHDPRTKVTHKTLARVLESHSSDAPGQIRVSDALTSDPIVGAQVSGVAESLVPLWGEFWSTVDAKTDARGRASIALPTEEAKYS